MRAYVVRSKARISPFGEEARDLPVGGVPLSEWQGALFRRRGIEPVLVERIEDVPSDEPRLITYDNVFFTRRVLKSFLQKWKARAARAVQVALPLESTLIERFATLQDFERRPPFALFNLWGVPKGVAFSAGDAEPLAVIFKERVIDYRMPRNLTGVARWPHPITSSICFHVTHWLHLLQVNRLSIQVRWVDQVVEHPIWTAGVLLAGLLPGRGKLLWRLARRANRIGKNVDVHPTARIEASFIGDGVRIGPQALVRASIIGKGSVLEERVNVSYSVVGDDSFVSKNSVVYACASMEGADLGMTGMQMCLVGRRAALTPRATPTDVIPGRKIKVRVGARFEEIDLPLLGSCFGHDTYVGADLYIAPGREIPNGVRIGPQPERVLSSIPESLEPGRLYTVRNGRLSEP